jgi:hypothetical protein
MTNPSPLLAFLADRQSCDKFDQEEWSLLFAEARACGVMPRLATELDVHPCSSMPAELVSHLLAGMRQAGAFREDVRRELRHIDQAVEKLPTRVILLKGAAYVAADLPAAHGRIFSDIDLLVERKSLGNAEAALMLAGWNAHQLSEYDRRYYREWSHEVPPMTHLHRETTIDLHHSLVMPTCRIRVDSVKMIEAAVAIPGTGNWFRLKDEDLVLHAASHLLLNSEFDRGLRDLWDISILLDHFGNDAPDFTDRVLARAVEVGLDEIARSALTLCHQFFGLPLPVRMKKAQGMFFSLLKCAANPRHTDTRPRWQGVADMLLLFRELSLRLPPHLLLRHMWHKTRLALSDKQQAGA